MEKTLQQKIALINEFRTTFSRGAYEINPKQLLKTLSVDEILHQDFENQLVPAIISYRGLGGDLGFIDAMQQSYMTDYMKELHKEGKDKIYQKLIDAMKRSGASVNSYDLRMVDSYRGDFLVKIIDNEVISKFYNDSNRVFIKDCADHIMSFSNLADINKIYDTLTKDPVFKDLYVGYPLVIINKNLSKEDKVKIIKKTYIQKDLNKYTTFIRENLTDFNDLDDFIEATITQNNRVKEKSRGIVDLIRRLFFGLRGESYYNILENLPKIIHKDEFMTKYRDLLNEDIVEQFGESSAWSQRQNLVKFFRYMYNNQPFRYKMKIALAHRELGEGLFSIENPIPPKEIEGNVEDEKTFYTFFVKNYSLQSILSRMPDRVMPYINKYPELFVELFAKEMALDNFMNSYNFGSSNMKEKLDKAVDFLSKLDEKNLPLFRIFSNNEYFTSFGFRKPSRSYNEDEDIAQSGANFFTRMLPTLEELMTKSKGTFIKEFIFDNYLIQLEDDDFVNDVVTNVSIALNNGKILKYFMRITGTTSVIDAIARLNILVTFVEKNFSEYDTDVVIKNIIKIKNDLSIICSL